MFAENMLNSECNYYDIEKLFEIREINSNEVSNQIVALFLNIRNTSKNFNEFCTDFRINEKHYDILCFAEIRPTESSYNYFVSID